MDAIEDKHGKKDVNHTNHINSETFMAVLIDTLPVEHQKSDLY